jgi:hypothetical protein
MSISSKARKGNVPAASAATSVKSNGAPVEHVERIAALVKTEDTTSGQAFGSWVCLASIGEAASDDGKWKKPLATILASRVNVALVALGSQRKVSENSIRSHFTRYGTLTNAKHPAFIAGLKEAATTNDPAAVLTVLEKALNVTPLGISDVIEHIAKHTAGDGTNDTTTTIADRMVRNLKSSDATLEDVITMLLIGKVKGTKVLGPKDEGSNLLLAVIRAYQDKKARKGLTKATLKAMNDLEKAAKA